MISNYSGEGSFFELKLVKNENRSTIIHNISLRQNRLTIELDIMRPINLYNIVSDFRATKTRKQFISVLESSTDVQSDLTIHISRRVGN